MKAVTATGDPVLDCRVGDLSDTDLVGGLRVLQRLSSQVEAKRAEFLAEVERRGLALAAGYGSIAAWLMKLSGEPASVCRSRTAVAQALQHMPATREAFAAGEVPEARVKLLAQAQAVAPVQFARDEKSLVAAAASATSPHLLQTLAAWKEQVSQTAAEEEAERLRACRASHVSPQWSGMVHLSGDLDPEGGLVVLAAVRSLSEAANLDRGDTRTPAQCRADALVEICRRYLDWSPGKSTSRPHVLITLPWDRLQHGSGLVNTGAGPLVAEDVRRLACDAVISRVLVDGDSVPVAATSAARVVPPAVRRALESRDEHCTYPGCDAPAHWCDAHHIIHWADGGHTILGNPNS